MPDFVQSVTGPIAIADLGATLVHEHVVTGMPGWQTDTRARGPARRELIQIAKDKIAEMQGCGIRAMVDPCPSDLARDIELSAEISQQTGFPIVAATGLYNEHFGATAYWKMRAKMRADVEKEMAEVFIRELSEGVGDSGIRPGIIKVATGSGRITDYERSVLGAAARACIECEVPIITHTDDGVLGEEQQAIFAERGVPAQRVIIGHSCGTNDHDYHWRLVQGGSYVGFDRFGIEAVNKDENRVASLLKLIERGASTRVVVSHDTVWCWRGKPLAPNPVWRPSRFSQDVVPMLLAGGASKQHIDRLLVENPRRYFAGEPLPALGS